jgi:hypothetical protein
MKEKTAAGSSVIGVTSQSAGWPVELNFPLGGDMRRNYEIERTPGLYFSNLASLHSTKVATTIFFFIIVGR